MADVISYASRLATDASLEAMWIEHRAEGIANCNQIWLEAERLKRLAARDQWPDADKKKLDNPNRKSPRMTIPETSRVLAVFSGRQILQRFDREYIPRNQTAARWAETITKVDRAIMQQTDAEQVDSAAFRDGPGIQGISWVRWYVDEWSGPKPQLKYETVPIWSMMWPSTRKLNLSDRGWQRWGSWWPQQTVRDRWPDQFEKIKTRIGTRTWSITQQEHGQSSRIPWANQAGNKPLPMHNYYSPRDRAFWIEYEEWRELITIYPLCRPRDPGMSYADAMAAVISNPESDPMEWVEMMLPDLREFRSNHKAVFDEDVPDNMFFKKPRMVYNCAFGCGDTILQTEEVGRGILGTFTFTAMAAEVIELPDRTLYISLMRDLEDAQRMVNYMMSALIRDLQINPKGVLFVEQGLFRDKDAAMSAWTSPGGVVEIPRGRLSSGGNKPWDYQAGGTSAYSSKLENMLSFWREAIPRLAGFNPAALGQVGGDIRRISGEVVRQLTDNAMTSNAERFDSLRLYRRECGRIFLAFLRLLYNPEDLIDFIGEEDAYDDVLDPMTGEPVIDPMTGEPQRQLAIPPKEMWTPDQWKEIAIEEVAPGDDELSAFWDKVQTQVQLLLSPMADTGEPLFTAQDWVDILPGIPAARRQKMRLRIQMQIRKMRMIQAQQQQMAAQAGAGGEGSTPAESQEQVA